MPPAPKEVLHDQVTAGRAGLHRRSSAKLKAGERPMSIFLRRLSPGSRADREAVREQGLNAQLLSGDSLNAGSSRARGSAGDGTMFTNAAEARNLPSAKAVVEEFRKGGKPGGPLATYAAIQAWAAAVEKAGKTDAGKVIAAALRSGQLTPSSAPCRSTTRAT